MTVDPAEVGPVETTSLTERVHARLREALMRGRYRPDDRLKIRELAASLGTSETPVREAIFQLVRDGALELKPRRYVRVRRLSVAEYLEMREIRALLEPLAAIAALPSIDAAALEDLAAIHRRLVAAERDDRFDDAIQANFDFHFGIYRRAGRPIVLGLLERLWVQVGPMLNDLYPHGRPAYDGAHQHELVLDAIGRRDEAALGQAIRDDLFEGGRAFLALLVRREAERSAAAVPDAIGRREPPVEPKPT
jgi:DNA-binding GntR family transcriptional regulator